MVKTIWRLCLPVSTTVEWLTRVALRHAAKLISDNGYNNRRWCLENDRPSIGLDENSRYFNKLLINNYWRRRYSIAITRICDSLILWFCLCVYLSVRTIKPKRLKQKSPNLAQGESITISRPPTNIGSKNQRSRSQGHKVHNVATRQPCGTVSLWLCRRATRRSRTAVSSHMTA